ncbi:serine hydrolase domain-containing protein [uncultured Acetobacteroides sp.]|uniref:serine hydrolase domain-containing protein n=1 Tax=uncultured Acetobacteroides sp. TaxID=1760811 RepID=UPI0029F4A785|nr:serine hydrolase domain-containing protein [uncultured Acetobacteroides sp.]
MERVKKAIVLVLLLIICNGLDSFAQKAADNKKPQSLTELKNSIRKILRETKTPGAGVVLVSGDKTIMDEGFGKASLEKNINANENTIFRLGSVSKTFVALAILKLQEEGRLNLKDKIKDIIPEIKFNNPWEATHPIRIENLLEYTSGWKYWSMAELGYDNPTPKTLKEALDFYPKTRTSIFVPGTKSSESNVGSAVAAYIVEKVSGLTFDKYMDVNFFKPMGMESTSFLQTEQYKKRGATLYENGIKLSYLNLLYRPAAALNSSAADMSKFITFLTSRGKVNKVRILSDSSICRMERGESFQKIVPKEFVNDCGFSNYAEAFNGFRYRGYGGSLPGGNANFGYIKESRLGYAVMINDGDEESLKKIVDVIRGYQTKNLKQKSVEIATKKYKLDINPSGYYSCIYPKFDLTKALDLPKSVCKVWVKDDTIYTKRLNDGGSLNKYVYAGNNKFRSVDTNGITLFVVNDPLNGSIIWPNLKKISPLWAYTLLGIFYSLPIVLFSSVIFGLLAVLVFLFGKKKSKVAMFVGLLPIITYSFILAAAALLMLSIHNRYDAFQIFGTMNPISIVVFICGIIYSAAAIWSAYYIFKKRREKMSKIFYFHSALATVLNLIIMIYFIYTGLIGIPTWI